MREFTEPGLAFHPAARRAVRFGPFRVDLSDGSLWKGDEEVRLPRRALAVLLHLVERPGRVVSKDALLNAVWKGAHVSESSLTEAIAVIRQALGDRTQEPVYIQTVHRRGYRFIAPISVDVAPDTSVPRAEGAVPVARLEEEPAVEPGARPRRRAGLAASVVALIALPSLALWFWPRGAPASGGVARVTITLPAEQAPAPVLNAHTVLALSPDGRTLVYVAGTGASYRLLVRRIDQFEARVLAGSDGGHGPFFSPDGLRVGFFSGNKLRHVALAGGEPVAVADVTTGFGATWTGRGTIVYAPDNAGGLWEVPEQGGTAREILAAPGPGAGYRWPQALDASDEIVATRWTGSRRAASVVAVARASGAVRTLVDHAAHGQVVAGAYLIFLRGSALHGVHYPAGGEGLQGDRVLVERVMSGSTGSGQYSVSSAGSMVYIPADPSRHDRRMLRLRGDGPPTPAGFADRPYQNLAICGTRLATTIAGADGADLWIGEASGGALTRATAEGTVIEPVWRPGCREITYASAGRIFVQDVERSGPPRAIHSGTVPQAPGSWSPSGDRLVLVALDPRTRADILIAEPGSGRPPVPFAATPAIEFAPRVSPDGAWMAYQSDATGVAEVFARALRADAASIQISAGGGVAPAWSPDGRQLFYRRGSTIYAAAVDPRRGPLASSAAPMKEIAGLALFKPLPREGEFLIVQRIAEDAPLTTVNLVIDWALEATARLRQ